MKAGGAPPSRLSCTLAGRPAMLPPGCCHATELLLLPVALKGQAMKAPACSAWLSGRSCAWLQASWRAAGQAASGVPGPAAAAPAAWAKLLHCGARPVWVGCALLATK